MKKALSPLLLLFPLIAVLVACQHNAPAQTASPTEVRLAEPPPYHATVEYGDPDLIADNNGPLWAYIRYPQAGDATDYLIARWAEDVYQSALVDIEALRKTDPAAEGELNIQFDSYLVDGRYAGIIEKGVFSSSGAADPRNILRTFNIDTESGLLLDNEDILDPEKQEHTLALLRDKILEAHPGADRHLDNFDAMDDSWLAHIAIGHEGILVLLEQIAAQPPAYDELIITLPYDELGPALRLGQEQASAPTPVLPVSVALAFVSEHSDIDPERPMVALTFDDGPSQHTERILDLLEWHGGRATFFVIGNLVENRPDTVRRAFNMGCEIFGHSWDHRNLTNLTPEEMEAQILAAHNSIEPITGAPPLPLFRSPYGAVNETLRNVSADIGFAIVSWSLDPRDWQIRNADAVHAAIMNNVRDRAIILSHDLYGSTADAMERVIPELIAQGYQLVTVSELLYHSGIEFEPGKTYSNGKPREVHP